jgi:F-type H+-transporting ATPase subunit b
VRWSLVRKQLPEALGCHMISVDWSIIPAILIFVLTVVVLNYVLFRPLTKVQQEREMRTTGLISQTQRSLAHRLHLFDQYQATIRNARTDGYRLVEKARSEALLNRNKALDRARISAEQLTREARDSIQAQVNAAKVRLEYDAQEIARRISWAILRRSA